MKKLSILICNLGRRKELLNRLLNILCPQVCKYSDQIEVLIETDNGEMIIGKKRNILINKAQGEYCAFIDDDDTVSEDYIDSIMNALKENPDVVGITGLITENGRNPKIFIHSLQYDTWFEKDNRYYRNNNHLNPIKLEYAKQVPFPEINHGEDHDYSKRIHSLLKGKKEVFLDLPIYFYDFRTNK